MIVGPSGHYVESFDAAVAATQVSNVGRITRGAWCRICARWVGLARLSELARVGSRRGGPR